LGVVLVSKFEVTSSFNEDARFLGLANRCAASRLEPVPDLSFGRAQVKLVGPSALDDETETLNVGRAKRSVP
jgi:hypothetical protein